MWVVMIASVLLVDHRRGLHALHARTGVHLPGARLRPHRQRHFWLGFAAGLTIGIYDYLGYNTTAYMGAEIKDPGRTLPRSIIFSILGIMAIYLLLQIGMLGVVDWHRDDWTRTTSPPPPSPRRCWRRPGARARPTTVTVLILITAFASVFAGLLGGSRVPVRRGPRTGLLPPVRASCTRGTASRCWAWPPWAWSRRSAS